MLCSCPMASTAQGKAAAPGCPRGLFPLKEPHWLQVPSQAAPGPGHHKCSAEPCALQRAACLPQPAYPSLPVALSTLLPPGWLNHLLHTRLATCSFRAEESLVRGSREGNACLAEEVTPAGRGQGCLPEKLEDLTAFPSPETVPSHQARLTCLGCDHWAVSHPQPGWRRSLTALLQREPAPADPQQSGQPRAPA